MKRKIAVIIFAVAVLVCLGILAERLSDRGPAVLLIPLQSRPNLADDRNSQALQKRSELLSAMTEKHDSNVPPRSELNAIEPLRNLVRSSPSLLASPDLSATVASIVNALHASAKTSDDKALVAGLCLELRWTPVRLNRFADACKCSIRQISGHVDQFHIQPSQGGLLIFDPDAKTEETARTYLRQPYVAEPIYELALSLMEQGYPNEAWHLQDELLQIDMEAATKLQSELSRLGGLKYQSHRLPW